MSIKPIDEQEQSVRDWTIAVVGGDTMLGYDEWAQRELGVGAPTPLRIPPRMEDERGMTDGVFIFTDVHLGKECTLEVVPQLSGNVEITLTHTDEGTPEDGRLFSLSHLDRADLFRALLHDFHYSTERGGPNDDQD